MPVGRTYYRICYAYQGDSRVLKFPCTQFQMTYENARSFGAGVPAGGIRKRARQRS
jgi:hypothetical protein